MFILSSISSGLEFWLVNHTSIYEKSELNVFKNMNFLLKYVIIDKTIYWEQMFIRLLNFVDNYCRQYCNGLIIPP